MKADDHGDQEQRITKRRIDHAFRVRHQQRQRILLEGLDALNALAALRDVIGKIADVINTLDDVEFRALSSMLEGLSSTLERFRCLSDGETAPERKLAIREMRSELRQLISARQRRRQLAIEVYRRSG